MTSILREKYNELREKKILPEDYENKGWRHYQKHLYVNPEIGLCASALSGRMFGCLDKYNTVEIYGKGLHNIVWTLVNGEIPKNHLVVHIDGCKHHNSISNLQLKKRGEIFKKCKHVRASNSKTQEVLDFNSATDTAIKFGFSLSYVHQLCSTGKKYEDWTFFYTH